MKGLPIGSGLVFGSSAANPAAKTMGRNASAAPTPKRAVG